MPEELLCLPIQKVKHLLKRFEEQLNRQELENNYLKKELQEIKKELIRK